MIEGAINHTTATVAEAATHVEPARALKGLLSPPHILVLLRGTPIAKQ
jgi:hypothetical protein